MTINIYKALLLCAFSFGSVVALAQTTKPHNDKVDNDKAGLSISLNYLSNSVYLGRADSVRTSLITPKLKYTFEAGIYLSAGIDLIPGRRKNKVDGGELALGWDYDITDDLSGGLSYTHYFYASTSTQVASAVAGAFNAFIAYDIAGIITPTLSADYNINKQGIAADAFINIGLSHDFNFGSNDEWQVSPSVEANTGTQNFYNGYVTERKRKGAAATTTLQTYQAELRQYKLLDYEFSLPVQYSAGNFTASFTPAYALAQNQFKSAAVVKALGLSSQAAVFYFDIGLALKF